VLPWYGPAKCKKEELKRKGSSGFKRGRGRGESRCVKRVNQVKNRERGTADYPRKKDDKKGREPGKLRSPFERDG